MFSILLLSLSQTKLIWKVRRVFSRIGFFFYKTLFGIKYRAQEGRATTSSVYYVFKIIFWQLALAILFTIGLQGTNSNFVSLFTKIGITIPEVSSSSYGTLLEAVIGVGGVFIGLYYAAISAIGSAIYAKVPNNVRDLFAYERVGNAYMRLLASLTSFGVCLLAFHTAGFEPIIFAIPLLIVGAGMMIIGFIRLGARAFNLFDPTILSYSLFENLGKLHGQMQAGGYQWSNPSFQNHAHKNAQIDIETLSTLSEIVEKEPHLNGRPFANLCNILLSFLYNYEKKRKLIPTNSLWYRQQYEHPDWYRTSDTETSIAHETAAGLQPEIVRDTRWIESEVLPIVERCLKINLDEKRYEIVNLLLGSLDKYVQILAAEHQVEFAVNRINDIFTLCEKNIFMDEGEIVSEEPLEHMEICERLAIMPINVLVAYVRNIELYYEQNSVLQRTSNISWKSEKSIYKVGFAEHVLKVLEELQPRLTFEERIEGRIISENWYIQKLIAQKEAENVRNALVCFYEQVSGLYARWIETAKSSQHPWLEAQIISRESEYLNKLDHHTFALHQLWNDLNLDDE